jgi:hypothetical protein
MLDAVTTPSSPSAGSEDLDTELTLDVSQLFNTQGGSVSSGYSAPSSNVNSGYSAPAQAQAPSSGYDKSKI